MDPKLTILFLLISSVIALSHVNEAALGRMWRNLSSEGLRNMMPGRRRI
jgi:hypothetical protein